MLRFMQNTSGPVQSIDRVFSIIELLADAPHGMALTAISAAVGLHVSTTHRLLTALTERGYARKDSATGKYLLTLRFFQIGCHAAGVMDLLAIAGPLLDDLSSFSQEAVHLVKRDSDEVVYLYKSEPATQLVCISSYIGCRNPMYCTGVGKSMLAYLSDEEVLRIWNASAITAFTPNTITDLQDLRDRLQEIREAGYALDEEEHELGVRCVAAPIRNWNGEPVAAISIAAPSARLDAVAIARILPRLLAAAKTISQQLGFAVG